VPLQATKVNMGAQPDQNTDLFLKDLPSKQERVPYCADGAEKLNFSIGDGVLASVINVSNSLTIAGYFEARSVV
jgi:hypothetical protein